MYLEEFKNRVLPVKNKLYRFALRMLLDEEDAKDVVQEVLIRIWNKRQEMHAYLNLDAWCITMTKNLCLDKIRSKNRRVMQVIDKNFEVTDELENPQEQTESKDLIKKIHCFIDMLPEKQKMIIQLRDIEGHSYQEIAEMLNIDLNQVKVNLFRARKAIRDKIINSNAYGL